MKQPPIAEWLEAERTRIGAEAVAKKDVGGVILSLANLYRNLSAEQRAQADPVITAWAVSDEPVKRFDGLVLIDKFGITSALPSLHQLSDRLKDSCEACALHDRSIVDGIVRRLLRRGSQSE